MHRKIKPNPAIFTQNAVIDLPFTEEHRNIWIENAHIGKGWRLSADHVVTGVPENDWQIDLPEGVCIDMVPVDEKGYVVRPYGIDDMFKADELMDRASLSRLYAQRAEFRQKNYPMLERNYGKSVFYQLDLSDVAADYFRLQLQVPLALSEEADRMQRIHNRMLRSRIFSLQGDKVKSETEEAEAFSLLRNGLIEAVADRKRTPGLAALPDQIVWGRSPVRIDLAGGWTDTPPFSLYAGGSVVNMAIELNGQPPLQVYVKPCKEFRFVLRSIDMGATEVVETYDDLRDYRKLGSPFSIPRAALALCGFLPEFSGDQFDTLGEQLKAFGAGIEITLLAAIPAGSGLGTSSILAATVLGALNDFCGLQWSKQEIGTHTLVLEQLLTSGGGWQDQYGGILHGVKLLESERGLVQKPQISWLPESLFTDPAYAACHLLYYTGITRVAKNILGEIVRSMFLNSGQHLSILHEMKAHAVDMAECIQRGDFDRYGKLILKTWQQNKMIDSGTNPPEVERIIDLIKDYTLGYKLPGAGGGGYLYMVAKDPDAAVRIRKVLEENRPNDKARFVEMQLSHKGFQVSRS
jgi:galactokinase/mevalonate kinase-like predicted kinase